MLASPRCNRSISSRVSVNDCRPVAPRTIGATSTPTDAAAEVFVFLNGECDAKVDGVVERYSAGEVLYVPAEQKHELANVGKGRLEVWLTVTPNVTPSHTFYEEQPDGTWLRTTPRLDGLETPAPSA